MSLKESKHHDNHHNHHNRNGNHTTRYNLPVVTVQSSQVRSLQRSGDRTTHHRHRHFACWLTVLGRIVPRHDVLATFYRGEASVLAGGRLGFGSGVKNTK